jgi:hypothetical protein
MKKVALICLLTLPAIARADNTAPPASQPPPAKAKKICRQEDVLGSIIPAHVCLTKEEWATLDAYHEKRDQSFMERRKDHFNAMPQQPPG